MALQIPRVDFSVYNMARQTNYDIEFAKLREEERRNQRTAGLVQSAFELAGVVGNVLKEADLEKNKAAVAGAEAKIQEAAMQAIANNDFTEISDENGQTRIELGQSYKETIAQLKADLPQSAFLPSTKKWIDSTLSAADNQARLGALNFAYTQFAKQRDAAAQENLGLAVKGAASLAAQGYLENEASDDVPDGSGFTKTQRSEVRISEAFDEIRKTVDSQAWRSPDDKARLIKAAYRQASVEFSSIIAKEKATSGGLAAATDWLDTETGWTGAERATILAAAADEDRLQGAAVVDRVNTAFDAAIEEGKSPVLVRTATLSSIPAARRGAAAAEFDKRQADWAHNQTMKTLSQVNTLDELLALRNVVQKNADGRYYGEKGSKTWDQQQQDLREIDSKINFFGGGTGSDKAEQDAAESLIRRMEQQWEEGVAGQTGYGILSTINEYENQGRLSPATAHRLRGDIINKKFPAAAGAFDSMRKTSMAILGMAKEPTKAEDKIKLEQFTSTMSAFLTDKLMEYGGNVTPAVVAKYMETARQVVTMKELDEAQKRLFDKEGDPLLRAIRALDSEAGRTAVFTDVSGKTQFLKPGVEQVYETRASMEVDYLGKLGIKVASSAAEAEDARGFDITGAKIHQGEDGKQYRLAESGGKIIVLSRSGSGGEWKEREPPKASAAPPAGPATGPAASAGDLTKVSGVDKYLDTDISATWEKATRGIAGRDRMMLPTTKKAQIAWLIKQGYLSE